MKSLLHVIRKRFKKDIILNEIFIARYQKEIQEAFAEETPSLALIDKMHKLVKSLQEANLSALDSLNLTKAKKDSLNKSPESTPSRIITAFAIAVSTMSPQERDKNKKDIEDAMKRLRENEGKLIEIIPSDAGDDSIVISE